MDSNNKQKRKGNQLDPKVQGVKNNLYSNIKVSLGTMNVIITLLIVLLVVAIAAGLVLR